jgi:hypothetical protein
MKLATMTPRPKHCIFKFFHNWLIQCNFQQNINFSIDLTLGDEFRYFVHHNGPVPISDEAGAKDYQKFSRIVS